MKSAKITFIIALLALLLVVSSFDAYPRLVQSAQSTSANTADSTSLLQYEWPQLQGDSSSTRFSPGPAPEAADILWKTTITGIQSYAAAFNGKVFVTTATEVIALDKDAGSIIWHTVVQGLDKWPAVYKIDDTHLVAGESCLNIDTGVIVWTNANFAAGASPFAAGCYSPEEKMFYTETNSSVQAWNFTDISKPPTIVWQVYISGGGNSGASVQYGDGKVFPGSYASNQIALDAKNGTTLWDTETKASMLFAGSYSEGKFFRGGTQDNTYYCFNANNGSILWTFNPETADGYWATGSAVAYGMVYALNKDGYVYAMNDTNGHVVWKYKGSNLYLPGYPVVADGKVYATIGQNAAIDPTTGQPSASEFACLDAFIGKLIWTLPIQAYSPKESVAIAYGNIYLIPSNIQAGQMDSYNTLNQVWALGTAPWSMYRANPQHTATGNSGPANLTLLWSFTTSGAVTSSPSAANGKIYVGSQDTYLYCLNARTGDLMWQFKTGGRIESSPAVVSGDVYVVSDDGYIYCLNAENGSSIWTKYIGSDYPAVFNSVQIVRSSPTVMADEVYVGSVDSNVYCLNAQTGTTEWTYKTGGVVTASPAVDGGAVYITSQEPTTGELYKIGAGNGSLIWKTALPYNLQSTGTDIHASPLVAAGMVFATSNKMAYYGVNASTGNIAWTYTCTQGGSTVDSPIYVNGKLYLNDASLLVCVNPINGQPIWSISENVTSFLAPTYADGKLYLASNLRTIYVVNATDGSKLSWFSAGSNFWSSPTIYEGRAYVGNQDWNIYCLANYAASSSSVTLSLSTSEVKSADLVTGWGQLTPGLSGAIITVTLTEPQGTPTTLDVLTGEQGNFTFTFKPAAAGNWTVGAQWISDRSYYTSASSENLNLQVQTAPTPTPTETPNATATPSTTPITSTPPTLPPFDKQTFMGIPVLYVYIVVVAALVAVILIAASFYKKTTQQDAGHKSFKASEDK